MNRAEACGATNDYAEQICGGELWEAEEWSMACIAADVDFMACLSGLECDELDRSQRHIACRPVLAAAHETCPEHFRFCPHTESVERDAAACGIAYSGCIDGNDYAVECTMTGDTTQCQCLRNEEVVSQHEVTDGSCAQSTLVALGAGCDFAEMVF